MECKRLIADISKVNGIICQQIDPSTFDIRNEQQILILISNYFLISTHVCKYSYGNNHKCYICRTNEHFYIVNEKHVRNLSEWISIQEDKEKRKRNDHVIEYIKDYLTTKYWAHVILSLYNIWYSWSVANSNIHVMMFTIFTDVIYVKRYFWVSMY